MTFFNANISALKAYSTKIKVSANNTANLATPEYKSLETNTVELKNGGVSVTISRNPSEGPLRIPCPGSTDDEKREGSNVDLEKETVDMIETKRAYQANARAVSAEEEVTGSLLDIIE